MNTSQKFLEGFKLAGIALPTKTTNENGQSAIDCGNLWQQFEKEDYKQRIPGRINNEILAVYYNYEGDYTQPFSYFIGCKITEDTVVSEGLKTLTIEAGNYKKITAKGKMPDCVANAWREIWNSDLPRAYRKDFEIYDEKSHDWNNAEVTIFLS